MKPITAAVVEVTWMNMAELPQQDAEKMVDQLHKEQPEILSYLLSADEALNEDEKELLLYLGIVVWRIMSMGGILHRVTEEMIDKAEAANIELMDKTDNKDIITEIMKHYNQIEVLRYVVEALTDEPEEDTIIRDEYLGIMMIYLKTVIDCFDR